jgi:hypothetical protein
MSLHPLVRTTLVMDALLCHEHLACRSQGARRAGASKIIPTPRHLVAVWPCTRTDDRAFADIAAQPLWLRK